MVVVQESGQTTGRDNNDSQQRYKWVDYKHVLVAAYVVLMIVGAQPLHSFKDDIMGFVWSA